MTTWKIDPSHTTVEFSAKHLMFTTVKGRFADVEGNVTAADDTPGNASVDVVMKAASIDTRTEQRDGHLRSPDFLDVVAFPLITFKSTKADGVKDKFTLTGDLTIRGVTRPVALDVEFVGTSKSLYGQTVAGFGIRGTINRKEFGISFNAALETGGFALGDKVKLELDIEATEQPDAAV